MQYMSVYQLHANVKRAGVFQSFVLSKCSKSNNISTSLKLYVNVMHETKCAEITFFILSSVQLSTSHLMSVNDTLSLG